MKKTVFKNAVTMQTAVTPQSNIGVKILISNKC